MTARGPDGPDAVVLRAPGLAAAPADAGRSTSVASADRSLTWLAGSGTLDGRDRGAARRARAAPQVSVDVDEVEVERSGGGLRTVVRHAVEQGLDGPGRPGQRVRRRAGARPGPAGLAGGPGHGGHGARRGRAGRVRRAAGRRATVRSWSGGCGRARSTGVDGDGAAARAARPRARTTAGRSQWRWEVVPDARRAPAAEPAADDVARPGPDRASCPAGPTSRWWRPGSRVEVEDDRVEVAARRARARRGRAPLGARDGGAPADLGARPRRPRRRRRRRRSWRVRRPRPARPGSTAPPPGWSCRTPSPGGRSGAPEELADALELARRRRWSSGWTRAPAAADPAARSRSSAREADRTGDGEPARRRGRAASSRTSAPAPGLGLAGVGLALARVRSGPPGDRGRWPTSPPWLAARRRADHAGLELALLLRRRGAPSPDDRLLAALRRLGRVARGGAAGAGGARTVALGGRGVRLDGARPRRRAHRAAAASTAGASTASELARRTAAEARARLAADGTAGPTAGPWPGWSWAGAGGAATRLRRRPALMGLREWGRDEHGGRWPSGRGRRGPARRALRPTRRRPGRRGPADAPPAAAGVPAVLRRRRAC